VIILRNQAVQTDRKVTTNILNVIIKKKESENLHTDRRDCTSGQEYRTTGSRRGINIRVYLEKYNEFLILLSVIIPVITGATGIVTKFLKETFGSHTRKMFDRLTTEYSYTWNITENTAVWNW